jgi:hypothetical protein
MKLTHLWIFFVVSGLLLAGCSSTSLSGSWKSPEYNTQVQKVYIIGIAKQETNRRIFEDEFHRQLAPFGVSGLSSYNDLPSSEEVDEAKITANIRTNGADSVLMAHVTGKRTEEVVNPGRVSSYGGGPSYGRPYYGNYGSYYNRRRDVIYEPATISQFEVITVEANLYDAKTSKLIWSAQLETIIEGDIQSLLTDFVKTVVKDLDSNNLI